MREEGRLKGEVLGGAPAPHTLSGVQLGSCSTGRRPPHADSPLGLKEGAGLGQQRNVSTERLPLLE